MSARPKRSFDREFKLQIVRQLANGEKRLAQVCREHDLGQTRLRSRIHVAEIVRDLHQADRVRLELTTQLRGCVLRCLEGEVISRSSVIETSPLDRVMVTGPPASRAGSNVT